MGLYVNEKPGALDLARALGEVSSERRDYALRYRTELDRKLSVAVYLLLKEGLCREYGIRGNPVLALAPGGKPYLRDRPDIHFSFSHCSEAAVCAISRRPVGVDVETIAPVDWEVARRVLSPEELEAVRSADRPDVCFARYWTMKEAVHKLRGEPLDDRGLADLLAGVGAERFDTRVTASYVLSLAG